MNYHVIRAIFRRNFVSYFSNPTGYVFICVFVLLGSFSAFWPDEFFNANLANLEQLNHWFPYIMLVFIPAITMSIWADERRQGTDELLLTIPAADIDVVLGKYFAAVAIFSVSLLFSLICNLSVLRKLGAPDVGLLLGTYFGYWMVGLAMLAIGMVASFLTSNLTVAFILGVAFNAPLVFLNVLDVIVRGSAWTATAKGWSVGEQMSDFGRGVISLPAICYFLMIVVAMLYLCMVLIGRRHWLGGRGGKSMGPHYVIRALALVALAVGVNLLVQNVNIRADVTQERLNSIAPETKQLISGLDPQHPVVIEAFISANVPEEFVQTRLDLLNLLREFQQLSGGKIRTNVHSDVEPLTDEAQRAEQQFGIAPQEVFTQSRGVFKNENIYLGAAITCGLEKMVIPFFERGVPVEYELVRSLATITQQKRKRVGVLQTDAELFGGFDFSGGMPRQRPNERLIEELGKQYEVVRVDPTNPITERYDVLLAVQPSSLTQPQMTNFIDAVRKGQPTAIFEDPLPAYIAGAVGTGEPRRSRQNPMMPFQQPQAEPKGNIQELWDLLGVELVQKSRRSGLLGDLDSGYAVVWQNFKPERFSGIDQLTPEYVFISAEAPHTSEPFEPFNEKNPITAGLQELILPLPGGLTKLNAASTDFVPLVHTGSNTGLIMVKDLISARASLDIRSREGAPTNEEYVLAARITGKAKATEDEEDAAKTSAKDNGDKAGGKKGDDAKNDTKKMDAAKTDAKSGAKDEKQGDAKGASSDAATDHKEDANSQLNVVLVADIDMLAALFFDSRARRSPDTELQIDTDNVTFVLNALDVLAGDMRFVQLRNKRPMHRPLEEIVKQTEDARKETEKALNQFKKASQEQEEQLEKELTDTKEELNKQLTELQKQDNADPNVLREKGIDLSLKLQVASRRKEVTEEHLRQETQKQIEKANSELVASVHGVQDTYKLWSVILPPVPPLLVAFFVYFYRRTKEREGVAKARLR
ncbi:MAG TPA: Gldg family protein [Pirellulales bacterium]|jgi:ABC-2 type transport system permease protein|nr:Gldg family protein [Pirellulales bacterium]